MMNALSLSTEEVTDLCAILRATIMSSDLKRQAIVIAHGGHECPDCLTAFDLGAEKCLKLFNKINEFAED